jgi:hypothetical protein
MDPLVVKRLRERARRWRERAEKEKSAQKQRRYRQIAATLDVFATSEFDASAQIGDQ